MASIGQSPTSTPSDPEVAASIPRLTAKIGNLDGVVLSLLGQLSGLEEHRTVLRQRLNDNLQSRIGVKNEITRVHAEGPVVHSIEPTPKVEQKQNPSLMSRFFDVFC